MHAHLSTLHLHFPTLAFFFVGVRMRAMPRLAMGASTARANRMQHRIRGCVEARAERMQRRRGWLAFKQCVLAIPDPTDRPSVWPAATVRIHADSIERKEKKYRNRWGIMKVHWERHIFDWSVYLSSFWLGLILIMPASVAVLRTSAGVMDARTVVVCTVVHVKMREEYDDVHAHRQIAVSGAQLSFTRMKFHTANPSRASTTQIRSIYHRASHISGNGRTIMADGECLIWVILALIQWHKLDGLGRGCISKGWRGDNYADELEAETWKGRKESVAAWLCRKSKLEPSK
ncbi:hypothetical protein B0H14DRAFT_3600606 [Mycena olivaceomarginata]|nr:hypothetical protein B0H14DRAFT_3600606 [Mycena olivaceomarginata]